jgi:hypothetical protein
LNQYGLKNNVITCLKDQGANLNVIALALKCVVNSKLVWKKASKALALTMYFPRHTDRGQQKKVCKSFKYISIKSAQFTIQKNIIWPRHFGKGK